MFEIKEDKNSDEQNRRIIFLEEENKKMQDKINYIYKSVKRNNLKGNIKLVLFIGIIGFIFFYIPSLSTEVKENFKNKIINEITTNISKIVIPMVKNMSEEMLNGNGTIQETLKTNIEKQISSYSGSLMKRIEKLSPEKQKQILESINKTKLNNP